MGISVVDARNLLTKKIVSIYSESTQVFSFGRSFFKTDVSLSKNVSIEVERGGEFVAVDVLRNTDGNYNKISRSTEKIIEPAYYSEYISANESDLYDVAIASGGSAPAIAQLSQYIAKKVIKLRDKIERAYERQAWQVLESGVVTLQSTNSIDFKRKSGSLVDIGGANYWNQTGSNPLTDLANGALFLRTVGKSQGAVVNCVMGSSALDLFINNDTVKEFGDLRNYSIAQVRMEQRNSLGASLYGAVTAGSWNVLIWTYPEYYDENVNGTIESKPYVPADKFIMIPEAPNFTMAFGAVPQLIENGSVPQTSAYLLREFLDDRRKAHEYYVESAGIAIPVAVDQIYTAKVAPNAGS